MNSQPHTRVFAEIVYTRRVSDDKNTYSDFILKHLPGQLVHIIAYRAGVQIIV